MIVLSIILLLSVFLRPMHYTSVFVKDRTMIMKALLPFGVIIHHFFKYNKVCFFSDDTTSLGYYIVAVFFFISGYGLYSKICYDKFPIRWLYVVNHVIKLIIPLMITTLAYHILNYFILGIVPNLSYMLHDLKTGAPPLPYTWFVITYIYLLIIFKIYSNINRGGILLLLLLTFIVVESQLFNKSIPLYHYSSVLAFYAGYLYKKCELIIMRDAIRQWLLVISMFILIIIAYMSYYGIVVWGKQGFFFSFLFSISFIYLYNNIKVENNNVLQFLSSISYEMYLCQSIIFLLIFKWMSGLPCSILLCISLLANIVISYLMKISVTAIISRIKIQ